MASGKWQVASGNVNQIINPMEWAIRAECEADWPIVEKVVEEAFRNAENSDHQEHLLVNRMRLSNAYIPELSLVAELDKKIIAHILFSHIEIVNEDISVGGLALAPISVLPEFQNIGVGGSLIAKGHELATLMDFPFVVLIGHPEYYPKFGYQNASIYGVRFPFEVPQEVCFVHELKADGLSAVIGTVRYPKEFYAPN